MAARTVKLSTELKALAEPTFLIQDARGRIYVTVAVLEYAPDKAKPGKQAKDVQRLSKMFEGAREERGLSVRKIGRGPGNVSVQTEPPGVQTGPPPEPSPFGRRPPGRPARPGKGPTGGG